MDEINLTPTAEDGLPEASQAPEQPAAPEHSGWETLPRTTVVDVRFKDGGKVYYFDPGEFAIRSGDHVIVETARGAEFGLAASGLHQVPSRDITGQLRPVLRLATADDERIRARNKHLEKEAYTICQQEIERLGLDMQLASAEVAFDGGKILFFFTADGRVDFRELVKSLASAFHTRIELRQIGVRDKAKMIGGLGMCGRAFCCSEFLSDFQPVSIKMAKTQNLSLNPTKISGACGRLMCCLKYEQEAYEDLIKSCPKNESFVDTPEGRGTVTDVNLLRQTVKVRMEDQPNTIHTFHNCDICVWRNGKAKKTAPPIPDDWAPISSDPNRRKKEEAPDIEAYLNAAAAADKPAAQAESKPEQSSGSGSRRRGHRGGQKNRSKQGAQANQKSDGGQNRPKPDEPAKEAAKSVQPQAGGQNRKKQSRPPQAGQGAQRQDGSQNRKKQQPAASAASTESQPSGEAKKRSGNRRRRHRPSGAAKPQAESNPAE